VAIVLISGAALVTLCVFVCLAWQAYLEAPRSAVEQYVARYEPLRKLLPAAKVTGFLADSPHLDPEVMEPGARFFLAQFALSPRRVACGTAPRWVVVDSDHPEIAPEIAASSHWILSADLRNGVRLYRTR
jgi:hypothetical protein